MKLSITDLVTYTDEIRNGKLNFLYSEEVIHFWSNPSSKLNNWVASSVVTHCCNPQFLLSFLFINKIEREIFSVFYLHIIAIFAIICKLYILHDCTFKYCNLLFIKMMLKPWFLETQTIPNSIMSEILATAPLTYFFPNNLTPGIILSLEFKRCFYASTKYFTGNQLLVTQHFHLPL